VDFGHKRNSPDKDWHQCGDVHIICELQNAIFVGV
jgi:hypothetical protein